MLLHGTTGTEARIDTEDHLHIAATSIANFASSHPMSCGTFYELILNDFEVFACVLMAAFCPPLCNRHGSIASCGAITCFGSSHRRLRHCSISSNSRRDIRQSRRPLRSTCTPLRRLCGSRSNSPVPDPLVQNLPEA